MTSQQENPKAGNIVDLMRTNATSHELWQQILGAYNVKPPENLNISPFGILADRVTEIHVIAGCDRGLPSDAHYKI